MPASGELQHIGFIMDGNGRWATARGQSRHKGHEQGAKTLHKIIRALGDRKIPFATFFVFSSENWGRPKAEVKGLMSLLEHYLRKDLKEAQKNNVRIRFVGDISPESALSASMVRLMEEVQAQTAQNTGLTLNLCINYGGRDEIVRTARKIAFKVKEGALAPQDITSETFTAHTDMTQSPPMDVCVRTGGEKRLSNFVLWHLSYAELFFTDTFWPGFDTDELDGIIEAYQNRQRRFGKLPENTLAVGE